MELDEIDQSNKKPWPKAQESDKRQWNKDDEEHLSSFFYILQESDLNLVPPSRISRAATTPDRIPGPPAPCESGLNLMLQKCKQINQFRKNTKQKSRVKTSPQVKRHKPSLLFTALNIFASLTTK